MQNKVTLPQWLDDLIFKELKAQYRPRCSNMTNIDDNMEESLNYLGTYFPRSYAEAYCIFSDYFQQYDSEFADQEELSIFDFGCGTGGEIFGLLTALSEKRPKLKEIKIVAFDGNQNELRLYEKVLSRCQEKTPFLINNRIIPDRIDDFYDMSIIESVVTDEFDIIISFKAICEFVTKQQFETKNPYLHFVQTFFPKLSQKGIMVIEDVTTINDTSDEWQSKTMDDGLLKANCRVIARNIWYYQKYTITHSQKSNDISKVAWRLIKK